MYHQYTETYQTLEGSGACIGLRRMQRVALEVKTPQRCDVNTGNVSRHMDSRQVADHDSSLMKLLQQLERCCWSTRSARYSSSSATTY